MITDQYPDQYPFIQMIYHVISLNINIITLKGYIIISLLSSIRIILFNMFIACLFTPMNSYHISI